MADIEFNCVHCERDFLFENYEGQFDHPPAEPVCDCCQAQLECLRCGGTGYTRTWRGQRTPCVDCYDPAPKEPA